MAMPSARVSDQHVCPMVDGAAPHVGGPIVTGAPNVIVAGMPAARVGDKLVCAGPADVVVTGSSSVLIGGLPAARVGDKTAHGGVIVTGAPSLLIGG